MASGFNRVILMGNLTANPELRYTPQGTAVTDLRLAVNTPRGKAADRKEDVLFIDVTVWDRQAETCCEWLKKGSAVLVEGRLQLDQWEDKESGQKRSKIRVIAQNVQFVGSGAGGAGGAGEGGERPERSERGPRSERRSAPTGGGAPSGGSRPDESFDLPAGGGGGDDIPF